MTLFLAALIGALTLTCLYFAAKSAIETRRANAELASHTPEFLTYTIRDGGRNHTVTFPKD